MSRRKKLQAREAAIVAEQRAMLDEVDKEDRADLSEEEQAKYDELGTQRTAVQKSLAVEEDLNEQEKRLARVRNINEDTDQEATDRNGGTHPSAERATGFPAHLNRSGNPQGFRGEDRYEVAYRCGMWCRSVLLGDDSATAWYKKHGEQEERVMGSGNTGGQILVPTEFSSTIIDLVELYGLFRQKAMNWPMGSDELVIPRIIGGATAYFTDENTAPTESQPTFDGVTLRPRTLAAFTLIPRNLADDAVVDLASIVARKMALAMATKEDTVGFNGVGSQTHGGISGLITECATATATVVTALSANTAFSTLDLVDFETMIGKLPQFPGINPEWYISKAGWAASMMRLADAAGGNTAMDIEGVRRQMFLGFPVNWALPMNSTLTAQTSTNGIAYFGDLSMAAAFGSRRDLTIESDGGGKYFEQRQVAIQGFERMDINVHDVGDTSVPGAVIMLATPSS